MVKFRNSGTKGAVVKSRVDITLTFKELQDNVLLYDIFAGGRAFGTGVSFSVGNTNIIIDTGDSEVMSGDIPGGGWAYQLQRNQKAKHSVPLLLLATRLLNKRTSNLRTIEQNRARLYADVHDDVAVRKLWVWCGDVRAFVWAFRL